MDELGDGELARRTQGGDRAAFAVLVERYAHRVRAICRIRLGSQRASDDLAQETFLRAFRGLAGLDAPDSFGSWLHGIALRVCQEWLRTKSRRRVEVPSDQVVELAIADELVLGPERADDRARVLEAVAGLPPGLRDVIELFYFQRATHQQMGEQLGITAAAVNARLNKARALLRHRLAERGAP